MQKKNTRIPHAIKGLYSMTQVHGVKYTAKYLQNRFGYDFLPDAQPFQLLYNDENVTTPIAPPSVSKDAYEFHQDEKVIENNNLPLVSIVLPIYNHAYFLPAALQSIINQTYKNWELIIVNDGSTDDFYNAVSSFLTDSRIKLVEQKNLKLPAALNNGFRFARGVYFTWTSADNIMLPEQIEVLVKALDSSPEYGFAYSDYTAIDDSGAFLNDPDWRKHNRPDGTARLHLPEAVTLANFHDSGDNFLGASFLWRSSVHDVVGAHDENCLGGEDYDFWLRMHMVTSFLHVPSNLYEYRVHDNTLNAKAAEFKIHDNVKRLLSFDKERRAVLLKKQDMLLCSDNKNLHWRNASQYSNFIDTRVNFSYYSKINENKLNSNLINILALDVPVFEVNAKYLYDYDILLTNDDFTYDWLKRQGYPLTKRILKAPFDCGSPIIKHAVALTIYDKDKAKSGYDLTRNVLPIIKSDLPKRLLLLVAKWGRGGLEQVVLDMASGAKKAGIQVTIGCTDEEVPSLLKESCASLGLNAVGFSGSAISLGDYVKVNSIDVVNYHHAYLGAQLLADMGVPTVYTIHNSYVWWNTAELDDRAEQLKSIPTFIAVSRQVAAYANKWLKIAPEKINVISNAVSLPEYDRRKNKKNGALFEFINVATFNKNKFQSHLINAFSKVHKINPDTRLKLVGFVADEDYLKSLVEDVERKGLAEAVTFVLGVDRSTALSLMAKSDCMVMPSIVEGWSIAASEAMLLGLPMILSNVGSAFEMQSISSAVNIMKGKIPNILDLNGDNLYDLLSKSDDDYDNRIAIEMLYAISNRDMLHKEAQKSIEIAKKFLSMERCLEGYFNILRAVK